MAKKRKRRRTSLLTKAINIGILLLAFQRPLFLATQGRFQEIANEATGGLAKGGQFNLNSALVFYGPMAGAVVLKKAISMVRRTARI